jgi:hypothetical protein
MRIMIIPLVVVNVLKLKYANPISTGIKKLVRANVNLWLAPLTMPKI